MDDQTIKERMAGRMEAEELLSIRDKGVSLAHEHGFAIALRSFADSVLGPVAGEPRVMTEQQAKEFESRPTKLKMYGGAPYKEIPIGFLAWLCDSNAELAAYLRSDRAKRRLETETD